MAKKVFKLNPLSQNSIAECIDWINEYKESLQYKTQVLVERLADLGITTAETHLSGANTNHLEKFVMFGKQVNPSQSGCTGVMFGMADTLTSHWYSGDGTEHNDVVEPLLMLEFGSGIYGLPPQSAFGGYGGQGTMAISGHENEASWWYATDIDENGKPTNWHIGTAVEPTRPMYNAWLEMYTQVMTIAREVFQ